MCYNYKSFDSQHLELKYLYVFLHIILFLHDKQFIVDPNKYTKVVKMCYNLSLVIINSLRRRNMKTVIQYKIAFDKILQHIQISSSVGYYFSCRVKNTHTQADVNNIFDVQLTLILMEHTWSDLKSKTSGCDLIRIKKKILLSWGGKLMFP